MSKELVLPFNLYTKCNALVKRAKVYVGKALPQTRFE